MLQPIEIFKPGKHTASSGAALAITAAELADAARVYDPTVHRAPLVIGHPKTDDLAYGHVWSLDYSEARKRLIASPAEVEPEFSEMVADGRLLAVSASFYQPTSPNNPVPGSYYLRHVGFLGAEAPAVKGLKRPAVQFNEAEEGVVEFGDWADSESAGLWRQMRDWLIGKFGLEEADKAIPNYRVDSLAYAAAQPTSPPVASLAPRSLSYSEGDNVSNTTDAAALAAQATQLAAERAALDARDADLAKREKASQHAARLVEFREFTGKLVTEGRLLPIQQGRLIAVMGALPEAEVLDFAEGDATVSKPALQAMREFLETLPKVVDFTERAKTGEASDTVDFNDSRSIAKAATEFIRTEAAEGRTVEIDQAVAHVMAKAD